MSPTDASTPIKTFGTHDDTTLRQIADVASRAERAALMADGHVGYVMPIGGVAAYRDQVSVVGVGVDIACVVAGTPVTTVDGFHRPVESIAPSDAVACWDGVGVRRATPNLGAVARGVRQVLRLTLRNGRAIDCTPDHEIRTPRGWVRADALTTDDTIACTPFVGLPYVEPSGALTADVARAAHAEVLAARGLLPLSPTSPLLPVVVRLLGYVCGDGHLTLDGKRISIYTCDAGDARQIAGDWERLGARPRVYERTRRAGWLPEHHVAVDSVALHALFAALGSPVGKKRWTSRPMPWLFAMPAWVRAHFLSAFCSAEMMTPRAHATGVVPNLQLKQAGDDRNAIEFIAALFRSLDYDVSVARGGPARGARATYVLQVLGGVAAQMRFFEEIGFCYATHKRERAAAVATVAWAGMEQRALRDAAKTEARALHAAGVRWRDVIDDVSERFDVPGGFVYHAMYDTRGASRRLPAPAQLPEATHEICWVGLARTEPAGEAPVFDVATQDPAHAFLASGVVVHNCGNAAIRTDLTLTALGATPEEVHARLETIADAVAASVDFGMGRRNRAEDAPVDHPLFDDPAWDAVPKKERGALRQKARQQLGTVGGGNHYVDLFADETGTLWVGVHFGSRGFGYTVASSFIALGQGKKWGERAPEREVLLDLRAPLGHDYWNLMSLAGRYAYAGREWVARKVVRLLGASEMELVHNHHNFAWKETHDGEEVVVIRKGATPAFPGQKGFVGGSMGDDAVIVQGTLGATGETAEAQRAALYSTVHGAGRVMSRTAAAGKRNRRTGQVLTPGRVSPEEMHAWLKAKGVILRGGGLDESPQVYRRLPEVLAAQEGTIDVLHTLHPLVVVMAGPDEFDPYKD